MTASRPPPGGASVSDLLATAAQLFRASLLKCLPMGMVAVLCAQAASIYWIATGHVLSFTSEFDRNYRLLALAGIVVQLWLLGAMMLRQRAVVLGAPIQSAAELRTALRRLPVILASVLLALLSVVIGVLALVLPGVFLMVCYLVLLPVVLFDGLGPYAALLRSVRVLRPLWWKALAACVITLLLFLIGGIVVAAIIAVIAELLAGNRAAFQAVETAIAVGYGALYFVFLSALMLVIHSAASSSA
ncbi:MAG TPA: hypothetical protein VGH84_15530 [Steroidobacteraceae bacterium]